MQLFKLDTVDSTNDAARRLLAEGRIADGALILADEQTAGRGTSDRAWVSPRGAGVYLSIVTVDAGPVTSDTTLHTLAAGVGCAEAITAITGIDIRLKPVNDLIAGGGKLGGILTEAFVEEGRLRAIITGIGINVRRADRAVDNAAPRPTCLEELMPPERFAAMQLDMLIDSLVVRVRHWQKLVTDGCGDCVTSAFAGWRVEASGEDAAELNLDISG